MSQALKPTEAKSLIESSDLSPAEIQILRTTIAKDLNDAEMALYLRVDQLRGLSPLTGQIHAIKRRAGEGEAKMTIQTGIDGYRLIADRTGRYAGSDDAIFTIGEDGLPISAQVTIYKFVGGSYGGGESAVKCAFTATARWKEYCPSGKQDFMWRKMPFLMLGKVAEALALRKAFPQELSGLYTHEELDQAEIEIQAEPKTVKRIDDAAKYKCSESILLSLKAVIADAMSEGLTAENLKDMLPTGCKSTRDLSDEQARKYIEEITFEIEAIREANRSTEEA